MATPVAASVVTPVGTPSEEDKLRAALRLEFDKQIKALDAEPAWPRGGHGGGPGRHGHGGGGHHHGRGHGSGRYGHGGGRRQVFRNWLVSQLAILNSQQQLSLLELQNLQQELQARLEARRKWREGRGQGHYRHHRPPGGGKGQCKRGWRGCH